jgi:hypothetical protein
MQDVKPNPRPEAAPDDVARWCEAVQTMPAEELAAFERRMRRTYQHHSLIDLIRAIVVRRAELERARRFRIKPTYQKPAGGFLAIGPPHPLESGVAVVSRISRALRVETGT